MGCAQSRYSAIEASLNSKSLKTGFESCSTDAVVGTIRRYAQDPQGRVNANQLALIKNSLGLDTSNKDLQAFYSSVTTVEKLLIAGVLLSEGSARDKATALFEVQDQSVQGKLTRDEVKELVTLVLTVILDSLSLLFRPNEPEEIYLSGAKTAKADGVRLLQAVLLGAEAEIVTKATLVENWSKYDEGKLLEPSGLREFLTMQKKA